MKEVFSSSYNRKFLNLITSLVSFYKVKKAVDIGTQQGASAIAIGLGMQPSGRLYTYDKFNTNYDRPPFSATHADRETAIKNLSGSNLPCNFEVCTLDAVEVHKKHSQTDILHIDLCNHYDNITAVLPSWLTKVKFSILLEGGISNKWQKSLGFRSYIPFLKEEIVQQDWNFITLSASDQHHALTVLTRK